MCGKCEDGSQTLGCMLLLTCQEGEAKQKGHPNMIITSETSFADFEPWAGAVCRYDRIFNEGKAKEFESLIDGLYPGGIDETALNDLLWFESDWVYESLGITDEEEEEE